MPQRRMVVAAVRLRAEKMWEITMTLLFLPSPGATGSVDVFSAERDRLKADVSLFAVSSVIEFLSAVHRVNPGLKSGACDRPAML